MSERQNRIRGKVMPNGNIRFYQDDAKKSSVSELQLQSGNDVAKTITTLGNAKVIIDDLYNSRDARVYGEYSPTLRCERQGLKVMEEKRIAKVVGGLGEMKSNGATQFYQQDRVYEGDIALTHCANIPGGSYKYALKSEGKKRIRRLTPKECFRLMGMSDSDFDKAKSVNSDSQLFKQAGNSIVVPVLEALFRQLNLKGVEPWKKC